jgi:hypothetical protein
MLRQTSRTTMAMLLLIAVTAFAVACGVVRATRPRGGVLRAEAPRPAPAVGLDLIYYSTPPFVLIRAFNDPAFGAQTGAAIRDLAGVNAVRFSSHGLYSHLGPVRTDALRREVKLPNRFVWFPVERLVEWVKAQDFQIVLGVNPEDGPEAALDLVERFRRNGAGDRIIAVELGNEPHLSLRPWQPEEYAEAAAAIIRALEPTGVRFALPLTLGPEAKTPTRISDDDYTRRQLAALDRQVPLAGRTDIYGVVHLYARGVDPGAIDALNRLVRPYAPRMRYLITEYNIRSTLRENQHLTTPYGLEFVKRTSRLVAHPDVAGLFAHGVPYHSALYWSGGNVVTVTGLRDERLGEEDLTPGWHATPAGRMLALFASEVWRGELLAFNDEGDVHTWIARGPEGEPRAALLNCTDAEVRRDVALGDAVVTLTAGPRSAAVYTPAGVAGRVELTREW